MNKKVPTHSYISWVQFFQKKVEEDDKLLSQIYSYVVLKQVWQWCFLSESSNFGVNEVLKRIMHQDEAHRLQWPKAETKKEEAK